MRGVHGRSWRDVEGSLRFFFLRYKGEVQRGLLLRRSGLYTAGPYGPAVGV